MSACHACGAALAPVAVLRPGAPLACLPCGGRARRVPSLAGLRVEPEVVEAPAAPFRWAWNAGGMPVCAGWGWGSPPEPWWVAEIEAAS